MSNIIHVSTIIENLNKEILLVVEGKKDSAYGKLNLPGGHLESNESILEGAMREAKEETGLKITIKSLVGIYVGYRHPDRLINFIFYSTTDEITATPENNEILECKWFSTESISKLNHESILNYGKLMKVLKDFNSGSRISPEIITDKMY